MSDHPGKQKLDELVAGLDGVTPGPWKFSPWHVEEDNPCVRVVNGGWILANTSSDNNAAHIARCDPDTIRSISDAYKAMEERAEKAEALVSLLRADLATLVNADPEFCEGCGAPIGHDEDVSTVSDVRGCWGYAADVKDAPCYRYRTEQGADRAWPECAALKGYRHEG